MTTPEPPVDPALPAGRPSSTGWPSDEPLPSPPAAAPPAAVPPPAESPAAVPTPAAESPAEVPVESVVPAPTAPVVPDLPTAPEQMPAPAPVPQPAPTAPDDPVPPPAAAARGRFALPVLALLITAALMALANAFLWYQVHHHNQVESARRTGLETSRDAARVLFSYDYRTLDKDFAAGKAITTGAFSKEYATTTATVVTPVAKEKKAVVKADVVTAGVVRATPQTVVTIVYVNQVTTSSLTPTPKVDLSRVRMTLTKVGSRWLVSKVEAL